MVRLFRVFIPVAILILLVSELLLLVGAYVAATFLAYEGLPSEYLLQGPGAINIGLVVITILLGLYLHNLYSDLHIESHIIFFQQLCVILGYAFLIQGAVSYLDRTLRMPLHVMLPGSAIALCGIFGWRVVFSRFALQRIGGERLLLVGSSAVLAEIASYLHAHPEKGIRVVGVLNDEKGEPSNLRGAKFLGRIDSLLEVVDATRPTRIVVGMQERRSRMPVAELLDLRYSGYIIEEAPATYERVCGRVCAKELRPSQLIFSGEYGPRRTAAYQHLANLVLAAAGVVIAAPIMILTALAVRLTSAGPILYRQVRVGMDGVPFTLYKFRSMIVGVEAGAGVLWAKKNDPRVTPVGRLIRKLRFDELPQLFNVLKGEMSIVGPRPERPEFVKCLSDTIPFYRQRHAVRPGITGWAQINYEHGDTLEDTIAKLEFDLYYIKNMSWSLDTIIMLHAIKAVLRGPQ